MMKSIIIFGLRGAVLVSRFALTIFITAFLGLAAVGEFGIINGVISVLPAVVGLGLHYKLNRELISLPLPEAIHRIRDRLITIALVSISILLLFTIQQVYGNDNLFSQPVLVIAVIFFECLLFDVHLNFISLRRSLYANFFLFVRVGAWVFPYMALAWLFPSLRTLDFVLVSWLLGILAAVVLTAIYIRNWPFGTAILKRYDASWVISQMKLSVFIYASDICMVVSMYLDRFFVRFELGIVEAGVFVFFWSLANGLLTLVNTSVSQPSLPALVDAFRTNNRATYYGIVRKRLIEAAGASIILSVLFYIASDILIEVLGKTELENQPLLFPTMLLWATVRSISDFLNYILYSKRRDNHLAFINIISVFVTSAYIFIGGHWGLQGVAYALVAQAVTIGVIRGGYCHYWPAGVSVNIKGKPV